MRTKDIQLVEVLFIWVNTPCLENRWYLIEHAAEWSMKCQFVYWFLQAIYPCHRVSGRNFGNFGWRFFTKQRETHRVDTISSPTKVTFPTKDYPYADFVLGSRHFFLPMNSCLLWNRFCDPLIRSEVPEGLWHAAVLERPSFRSPVTLDRYYTVSYSRSWGN